MEPNPRALKMLSEALRLAADALDLMCEPAPRDDLPGRVPSPREPTEAEKAEARKRLRLRGTL